MDRRGKKFLKRCKTRHFQFAGDEIERSDRKRKRPWKLTVKNIGNQNVDWTKELTLSRFSPQS